MAELPKDFCKRHPDWNAPSKRQRYNQDILYPKVAGFESKEGIDLELAVSKGLKLDTSSLTPPKPLPGFISKLFRKVVG